MFTRLAVASALAAIALAAPASARSSRFGDCPAYGDQRICTAQVPSFDGAPLDVDLTLPQGGGARHPLMILLHGFGNDKREWESLDDAGDGADKLRWNSHWFARHGFYVLTYTARGFRSAQSPTAEYQPPTPGGTSLSLPSGTIQIKSRDVEIRDTQYLASLVADTFADVDRPRLRARAQRPALRRRSGFPDRGRLPHRHGEGELHHRAVRPRRAAGAVRGGHPHDADGGGTDQRAGVERPDRRRRGPVPRRRHGDHAGAEGPHRVPFGVLPGRAVGGSGR